MEKETQKLIERYQDYADKNGFKLNPNKKILQGLIQGLLKKEKQYGMKYCPCRRLTGNKEKDKKIICPCVHHKKEIKEQGHCHCFLFVIN